MMNYTTNIFFFSHNILFKSNTGFHFSH